MKKLVQETLNEFIDTNKKIFKGEKVPGITIDDVDKKEFLLGMAIEAEHSSDLAVQKDLVLQHLAKNPKYYSKYIKDGFTKEVAAINLYKKYFIDKEEPEEKAETTTSKSREGELGI
jgi:hypothetical protein